MVFVDYLQLVISIHAPREGGDDGRSSDGGKADDFNPRPPRGGRLSRTRARSAFLIFQSTPPARGATQDRQAGRYCAQISIHAPREGGDRLTPTGKPLPGDFNPRPPRGGRPLVLDDTIIKVDDFNPRPPRGGRLLAKAAFARQYVISIHAPREGGDPEYRHRIRPCVISIHAPREGGDPVLHPCERRRSGHFNPRPPRGGRLLVIADRISAEVISIHAPREGGDFIPSKFRLVLIRNFNPRPPRGGRRGATKDAGHDHDFNPRPPRGGRPCKRWPARD